MSGAKKSNYQWLIISLALIGGALLWRGFLFGLGSIAPKLLPYKPSFAAPNSLLIYELPKWQQSWANFDGVHYLTIARSGYGSAALIQAFFPLWPFAIRVLDSTLLNTLESGLVLSTFFTCAAVLGWYWFARSFLSKKRALLATAALLVFPTSFYFGALYSEALFLSLLVWSWLAMKQRWWLVAGVLGGLAAATRITGIIWVMVLAIDFFQHVKKPRISDWSRILIAVCCTTLGLLTFMYYLYRTFGDPLLFLHVQHEFGADRSESLVMYPQVVWRYIKILATARPFDLKYFAYVQEFLAGTLGLFFIVVAWFKKIPKSLVIFSLISFLLPTLTGTFSSLPRYNLTTPVIVLLPVFIDRKQKHWLWLYLLFSTILLLCNTILFIQGYWVA